MCRECGLQGCPGGDVLMANLWLSSACPPLTQGPDGKGAPGTHVPGMR